MGRRCAKFAETWTGTVPPVLRGNRVLSRAVCLSDPLILYKKKNLDK